jgi:hypothetical protein
MRGVARELQHAFNNLSDMVPVASVAAAIRQGRNPSGLINWHHYREVLRGVFDRLGRLRASGGALGARKINGVFAAKRRKVRFRKTNRQSLIDGINVAHFRMAQKATKYEAGYQDKPAANGDHCSGCWMFQSIWQCCAVEGVINPNGWCEFFETVFKKDYNPDEPRDERGRWTTGMLQSATPEDFASARSGGDRSAFLSPKTSEELKGDRLYLSGDGKSGYALDHSGDLQNLFNNGGPRGAGRIALIDAIKQGATTLDAFDPYLPELYAKYGFVPTGRMKFADEYAPAGWNYEAHGRPDVVFMAYRGGDRSTIEQRVGSFKPYDKGGSYFTDYNAAKAASRGAVLDKRVGSEPAPLDGAHVADRGGGSFHKELAGLPRSSAEVGTRLRLTKATGDQFNFDSFSPQVQAEVREAQDVLIQQLETDARDTIDAIIRDGTLNGTDPEDIASSISDMIGLTDTQAQAVLNYQRMLQDLDPEALSRQLRNSDYDAAFQDAVDAQADLSEAAVESMVSDYIENYIDYRAATIAQTEATRAANIGLHDAYAQAVDRGALPEEAIKRVWQLGDNPCPICESIADNNPDGVGLDESFDSDDGPVDDPPVHPNCECSVDYVTDLTQVPDDSGDEEDIGPGSFGVGGVETPYMDESDNG